MLSREECIKLANNNKDTPTEEVLQDIEDTRREIVDLQTRQRIVQKIYRQNSGFDSRIEEREDFITKLNWILEGRKILRDKED